MIFFYDSGVPVERSVLAGCHCRLRKANAASRYLALCCSWAVLQQVSSCFSVIKLEEHSIQPLESLPVVDLSGLSFRKILQVAPRSHRQLTVAIPSNVLIRCCISVIWYQWSTVNLLYFWLTQPNWTWTLRQLRDHLAHQRSSHLGAAHLQCKFSINVIDASFGIDAIFYSRTILELTSS